MSEGKTERRHKSEQMNTEGECNHKMLASLSLFGHLGKARAAVTTVVTEPEVKKARLRKLKEENKSIKETEGGKICQSEGRKTDTKNKR